MLAKNNSANKKKSAVKKKVGVKKSSKKFKKSGLKIKVGVKTEGKEISLIKEFPLSQNIKEIPLFSFVRKNKQTDRQTNI